MIVPTFAFLQKKASFALSATPLSEEVSSSDRLSRDKGQRPSYTVFAPLSSRFLH
jgi:hypothetical protein